MLNGFTKTEYWTKKQVEDHGRKYSKSFTSSVSPWQTDFDKMGQKTVLKSLLNTYGELTQAMQIAVSADQAVCKMTKVQSSITSIRKITRKPLRFPKKKSRKVMKKGEFMELSKSGDCLRFGKYKK